ncbi:MAG: acyltransferase family protein, partial [Oscillospiraceae bacterium]
MPAFVVILGYFSKTQSAAKIGGLFLQYLIFQTLYTGFSLLFLRQGKPPVSFLTPYWLLWFLVSAMLWKIITPLLARLSFVPVFVFLVALSVFAGFDKTVSYYLSISRTLVFFPFYYLGYRAQNRHFLLFKKIPRWAAVFVFFCFFALLFSTNFVSRRFLYGAQPYSALRLGGWQPAVWRLAELSAGFILLCCFFALVPWGQTRYTALGRRTMQAFLLHGFVLRYLQYGTPLQSLLHAPLAKAVFLAALLPLTLLLLSAPVGRLFSPLFYPLRFAAGIKRHFLPERSAR